IGELVLNLARPDTHVNKAAADGAASFFIDHHVSVRVAKFTQGVCMSESFNSRTGEHTKRIVGKRFRVLNGELVIPDRFSPILPKAEKKTSTRARRV
ncbi:hypothetical protein C8R43DRAFT_869047, partial [Mycena crocata]